MPYQISDKIKKQTTKCCNNFACLNNDDWNTCSIEEDIKGAFLLITNRKDQSTCPYCFSYDESFFC